MLSPHIQSAPGCILTQRQRKKSKEGKEGAGGLGVGRVGARKKRKREPGEGKKRRERKREGRAQSGGGVIWESDVCISLFKPTCSTVPCRYWLSCVCIQAWVYNTSLCWAVTSELCVVIYCICCCQIKTVAFPSSNSSMDSILLKAARRNFHLLVDSVGPVEAVSPDYRASFP